MGAGADDGCRAESGEFGLLRQQERENGVGLPETTAGTNTQPSYDIISVRENNETSLSQEVNEGPGLDEATEGRTKRLRQNFADGGLGDRDLLSTQMVPDRSSVAKALQEAQTYDESIDKMLALELGQLSVEERSSAEFDLHGISDAIEETPELVSNSLAEMRIYLDDILEKEPLEEELNNPKTLRSSAYQMALAQNPSYAQNENLWIAMLRSVKFDSERAASKLLRFFQIKLDIFEEPLILTKDISITEHFSEPERQCLESGWMQIMKAEDNAGRTVLCLLPPLRFDASNTPYNHKARMKTTFYLLEHISRNEQCQKHGLVAVVLNLGKLGNRHYSNDVLKYTTNIALSVETLPVRVDGLHICSDSVERKEYTGMAVAKCNERLRFRSRQHYGSLKELKLVLMSFGIPCDDRVFPALPGSNGSLEFPLENHHAWYRRQVELEKQKRTEIADSQKVNPGDIVQEPKQYDILVGRAAEIRSHPGNVHFFQYLDQMEDMYNSLTRSIDKSRLSMRIVLQLKAEGSRFLKPTGTGSWMIQTDTEARDKVGDAFRGRRKKKRREDAKQEQSSSNIEPIPLSQMISEATADTLL